MEHVFLIALICKYECRNVKSIYIIYTISGVMYLSDTEMSSLMRKKGSFSVLRIQRLSICLINLNQSDQSNIFYSIIFNAIIIIIKIIVIIIII